MGRPLRLLLVDDDEDDAVIVRRLLAIPPGPGHRLDWQPNPDRVMGALGGGQYDAALVDYRLGGRDGLELVRASVEAGHDVPLVVLTGCDCPRIDAKALAAGAVDFLVKGELTAAVLDRTLRYAVRQKEDARQLRQARAEAEAANRAKDRFLAVLSHELRTPLTPILVAVCSELEGVEDPAPNRPMLEMIRRNVELETRLIGDLLDAARLGRGELPMSPEPTDVHGAIAQAAEICADECRAEGLSVRLRLGATSHHAQADPARLVQLAWNLIRNAARFASQGGTLEICSRDEAPPEGEGPGRLVVEFRDDGEGLPSSALSRIFEPFERGPGPTRGRPPGLGLGLAIARAVAEVHGGSLQAASPGPGLGTTFRLALPTIPAPAPSPQPAPPVARAPGPAEGLRILLVEDNAATRRYLALALRRHGHRVEEASCLEAARVSVAAGPPDLLISDVELPDGTGLELMRTLAGRGVAGVAISGFGSEEDERASLAAGFSAHLTKPMELDRLEAAIRRAAVRQAGRRYS